MYRYAEYPALPGGCQASENLSMEEPLPARPAQETQPVGDVPFPDNADHGIYIEKQVRVPTFTMSYEHFHPYLEIFYLQTGSCIYYVRNTLYHLTAGDIFIVAPGDSHCTQYEGLVACERIVVYCKPEAVSSHFWLAHPDIREKLARSGKVVLVKKGKLLMEGLLCRMLEENNLPDEYSYEFLTLLTMELLLCIKRGGIFVYEQIRNNSSISMDIEEVLHYIAQNYALPLTLEEVACQISLAPTYLSRKFKKVTGVTFKEYVNYIRIRQACQALLTTDDSITKIALNCGFNSSNYFKDIFRKINGISPRAYRKQSKSYSFANGPVKPAFSLTGAEHTYSEVSL
ncbi:MAG: AraC family transcriptional regulator [Clostridium sp.]|nr:AraC family transcriptional regulator [Clostridium sp.]